MKKLVIVGFVAVMSGCAAKVTPIPTGVGDGHLIECSGGAFSSWARCYKKAAEICKGGNFIVENPQSNPNTFGAALFFGTTMQRSMVVQCTDDLGYEEEPEPFVQ